MELSLKHCQLIYQICESLIAEHERANLQQIARSVYDCVRDFGKALGEIKPEPQKAVQEFQENKTKLLGYMDYLTPYEIHLDRGYGSVARSAGIVPVAEMAAKQANNGHHKRRH